MTQFLNENLMQETELSKLQEMVERQLKLETEIEAMEEALKELKKNYNNVRQNEIPEFLTQYGLSEIKLADGKKVTVKQDVAVTIRNEPEFFKFLEERHDDSIIKNMLEMEDPDEKLIDELMDRGLIFNYNRKVHGQTLKAYFRTFLEVGETPPDCVNVYTYSVTKIK